MKIIILFFTFLLISLSSIAQTRIDVGKVNAKDPDGDKLTFSITAGNTGSYFAITPGTGIISVDKKAYTTFIKTHTWKLTVKATDSKGAYAKGVMTCLLQKDAKGNIIPTKYSLLMKGVATSKVTP